ncbi:MAG: helix-turn-helix domain-containing protein [Acidobacteria bacterium]|nr:helix-turn-helix domain-containing protein [Acidobacteriota bacterium]
MLPALQVVQSPASAAALFHPERRRVLELLREPDSAAGVARRLQMPRQTVNYHVKALEEAGLVELVERRMKGNCAERVLQSVARTFVVSPDALGELGISPEEFEDRYSSTYLVAAAANTVREVAALRTQADRAGKRLATLTLEATIRFANAGHRKEFTAELTALLADLAARYNDSHAPDGRTFRVLIGAYPKPKKEQP